MRKPIASALLLTFALSGCASVPSGAVTCPKLPPVPASLMQPPTYGQKARAVLLETQTPPTQKSGDYKKS